MTVSLFMNLIMAAELSLAISANQISIQNCLYDISLGPEIAWDCLEVTLMTVCLFMHLMTTAELIIYVSANQLSIKIHLYATVFSTELLFSRNLVIFYMFQNPKVMFLSKTDEFFPGFLC